MSLLSHPDYCTTGVCDTPRCGNSITLDEHSECTKCDVRLCDGCTYECRGCGFTFCLDHIIVTELDQRFAVYDCPQCAAAAIVATCHEALELLAGVR